MTSSPTPPCHVTGKFVSYALRVRSDVIGEYGGIRSHLRTDNVKLPRIPGAV